MLRVCAHILALRLLTCATACLVHPSTLCGSDPWPFWGRTSGRIANTASNGPQTPTILWSVLLFDDLSDVINQASAVLDAEGRIFVGGWAGMTAVDSHSRQVLWTAEKAGILTKGAAVWDGRVVWGDFNLSTLYCYDSASGEEIWTVNTGGAMFAAPVIDSNGIIYMHDQGAGAIHARRIEDGSEVWTAPTGDPTFSSASLGPAGILVSSGGNDVFGLDVADGSTLWTFSTARVVKGTAVVSAGRVYVASWDANVYCLDASTGDEFWRFDTGELNNGALALGHDGTIFTATLGNSGTMFAVSPEGKEMWRLDVPGNVLSAPMVAGDGIVYLCSQDFSPDRGWVIAMRPDGTELWSRQMPDHTSASPMIAPDGTLYVVCRDKFLYAFKDPPPCPADIDSSGAVDFGDLLAILVAWGPCGHPTDCPEDLDADGVVAFSDIRLVLVAWGPCAE